MKVKDITTKEDLELIAQTGEVPEVVQSATEGNKKGRVRERLGKAFNFLLDAIQAAGTIAEIVGPLVPAVGVAGGVANTIVSGVKAVAQGSGVIEMFKSAGEMFNSKEQEARAM